MREKAYKGEVSCAISLVSQDYFFKFFVLLYYIILYYIILYYIILYYIILYYIILFIFLHAGALRLFIPSHLSKFDCTWISWTGDILMRLPPANREAPLSAKP
jgi:hypothetical protein